MTPGEPPIITNTDPELPVVINPGGSHLENFTIIEPWEYLLNWGNGGYLDSSSPSPAPDSPPAAEIEQPHPLGGPPQDFDDFEVVSPPNSPSPVNLSDAGSDGPGAQEHPLEASYANVHDLNAVFPDAAEPGSSDSSGLPAPSSNNNEAFIEVNLSDIPPSNPPPPGSDPSSPVGSDYDHVEPPSPTESWDSLPNNPGANNSNGNGANGSNDSGNNSSGGGGWFSSWFGH
jgi:hypothetical protein